MSYLRRLDQARMQLGEGKLLAAELELREATAEWRASRLRAPLVEKGLEPALRAVGRIFGRKSDEPVLPVFSRRSELLREDLFAFARALAEEVIEVIGRGDLEPARRVEQATEALTLQRSSEFFALAPALEWEVVKVWLADSRRLGLGVRVDLLPPGPAPEQDSGWWLDWLEDWTAAPTEPVRAFADWGRRIAIGFRASSPELPARWAWVEARLAILDPLAGPLALPAVADAIEFSDDAGLTREALGTWAELVTNLRLLATPGGNAREDLEARAMEAARVGLQWPPPDITAQLDERRPCSGAPVFVAVQWHDDATAVAFVLHDGRRAVDVLCIKPSDDPDPDDAFAMEEGRAQRRIAAWIPQEAILLSAREPGPRLRGLVGSARWIPLEGLIELLGGDEIERAPAAPATGHPAWTREICSPWDSLVPAARRLVPVLDGLLETWPSMVTLWGRENLRRIGSRGVPLAEALAAAAGLFGEPVVSPGIVETSAPLNLAWPPLDARPWPVHPGSDVEPVPVGSDRPGRVWIDRAASGSELATVASRVGPANLLCVGEERALELAEAVAGIGDPVRVAVVGPPTPCAAPLLELLNRWITESPGDLERGRAAVWLLTVLSESPGHLEPLLSRSANPALVEEVRSRMLACSGDCGSHAGSGCWPEQALDRVVASQVTVIDVGSTGAPATGSRRTVVDDLRSWVVDVPDEEALRRLRTIPPGPHQVTVFTPGVAFLPAWLGSLPSPDGGDADWQFIAESSDRGPAIWSVSRGYGAQSSLLAREARSLIEERVRRWFADFGEAPLWGYGVAETEAALQGVAVQPTAESVLLPALGEDTMSSPLLIGLRLAAAASHAHGRVVCLSPVLADAFDVSAGLVFGEDDGAIPRALDPGSALLASRRGRTPATWTSPVTRPRLDAEGANHARKIAGALLKWQAGHGRVLAGASELDREALIRVLCRLQSESLDGGPLGVRAVVIVVPELPASGPLQSPELRLRGLDRGRKLVALLTAEELDSAGIEDWARRNPSVAWVFRNAEIILAEPVRAAVTRVMGALRRSEARTIFFTDHVEEAALVRDLVAPHLQLDPLMTIEEFSSGLDPGPWKPRTLGALDTQCPDCGRAVVYAKAFELCPDCGVPVDSAAPVRRALRIAFEGRVVDALRQLGPQATWTLVVFDPGRRSRLHQRLGLNPGLLEDTPLLKAAASGPSAEVLLPEEFWRAKKINGPVIVCGLPDGLETWDTLAGRLRARGLEEGEWWLPPPGLDESELLPSAEPGFEITREEFLQQLGGVPDRVAANATLRRLEAAGAGWSNSTFLRVHELVGTSSVDDAPLEALAEGARSGWVRAGSVVGLQRTPPPAFERAVRSGHRLRREPARPGTSGIERDGELVGIAGWGKTTVLLELAAGARDGGESVLVLVPDPVHRLEWVERLADPTVSCLDFNEFLLDLVESCAGDGERVDVEQLRVLPRADRKHGEEVRLALVRTVSQLYEQQCGELPALDSRSLVRALEGERLVADPVGAETNVDFAVLARCVEAARAAAGWIDSRQLLGRAQALARATPERIEARIGHFDLVLVDDAHDLPAAGLEFLRRVFGARLGRVAVDPVLGLVPDARVDEGAMQSRRFGPAIADAIECVWRAATPLPGRVRGRGPGGARVDSERILALTAAVERIAEELGDVDDTERVAIVAAHERDRRLMEQQLGLRAISVDGADRDFEDLVTGPREILAALAWVMGLGEEDSAAMLAIVLAAGPETGERENAVHYEGRLRRRLEGEAVEVLDRVEAFLLPLLLIRNALGPSTRVDRAVEVLLGCGLLQQLNDQPAMSRRIRDFVRQHRGLSVVELLEVVPRDRILRPCSGGRPLRILAPDQLGGRSFDRIYYICTGFEPPKRHYRVLSRASSAVKIACSEVDPLQG